MDEIDEMLTKLLTQPLDKVQARIKEKHKAQLFQPFFDEGHASATGSLGEERRKLEKRAGDAEAALTAAKDRVKKLEEQNPDVAKLHSNYSTEIQSLKDTHERDKEAWNAERQQNLIDKAAIRLHMELVGAGVVPEYAEVLAARSDVRSRIHPDEKGKIRVLQPGKAIPYAGEEHEQISSLAGELKATVKPIFLTSAVKNGSGREGEQSANGTNGDQQKAMQAIRDKVKAKFAVAQEQTASDRLDKRIGRR